MPVTLTASLMLSVSVMVLPALRSPLAGDSTIDDTVNGDVVAALGMVTPYALDGALVPADVVSVAVSA